MARLGCIILKSKLHGDSFALDLLPKRGAMSAVSAVVTSGLWITNRVAQTYAASACHSERVSTPIPRAILLTLDTLKKGYTMQTYASPLFVFRCEMDLALTYAMSNRRLARECAVTAQIQAIRMGRPDLTYQANELLGVL
jgi:hypothetical protein